MTSTKNSDKNFPNLVKVLDSLGKDLVTKADFMVFVEKIAEWISKIKEQEKDAVIQLEKVYGEFLDKINNNSNELFSNVNQKIEKVILKHDEKLTSVDDKLKIVDQRMSQVKDGEPGIDGIDGSPDTPQQIRDKLEELKQDERLDKSAIRGLEDMIKEIATGLIGKTKLGGNISYGRIATRHIQETPSGSIDSSNDIFYLSTNPTPNSLVLTKNGQVLREGSTREFTLNGKTITFNANADTPQTGDALWAKYEKL